MKSEAWKLITVGYSRLRLNPPENPAKVHVPGDSSARQPNEEERRHAKKRARQKGRVIVECTRPENCIFRWGC